MENQKRLRQIGVRQFGVGLNMPDAWFLYGRQLMQSAEVLLRDSWECRRKAEEIFKVKKEFDAGDPDGGLLDRAYNFTTPALLVGFALENFLKGLWVRQNAGP